MRHILLALALALSGGSAFASSIEVIHDDRTSNDSIITVGCATCPPLKQKQKATRYDVPFLAAGTQKTSIHETDGKMTMVRTEAWLGGSPVTYVSANPAWMPLDTGTALADDGIDTTAKTAAVVQTPTDPQATPAITPLNLDNFALRQ